MIGAIIGDIAGSRFEFNNTNDYNFELFAKDCSFTDDTICTVAIADAILKGIDYQDSVLYWCRKYANPMGGYGGSFANWLASQNPLPYNSFGNGSAMRVSPVAWAFNTHDKVVRESINTAKISHNHTEGIIGAIAIAEAVFVCRSKESRLEKICTIENIASFYYGNECFSKLIKKNTFDETCQGTVPLALHIVINSTSFEDAIRKAISYGGDSDTLGAIVGSIAEPLFGVSADIETKALKYISEDMKAVITQFKEQYK